jgi:Thoeris protein ThsB, TIR-like domain
MARRVFFSFHYQRDVWRVNQIRNMPNVTGCAAAGFQDGSLWEEAKKKGEATIKAMIRKGLENTSVTVVCVGNQTAGRKYINYEIQQSIDRGNGIVAVQVHHLKDSDGNTDPAGAIPAKIESGGYQAYKYANHEKLAKWIEDAAKAAGK